MRRILSVFAMLATAAAPTLSFGGGSTTSTSSTSTTTTTSTTSTTVTLPPSGCQGSPTPMCNHDLRAVLDITDNPDDSKDQIKWKFQKGDAFTQADLGNPATTRAYSLCVYDETAGVPSLVATLTIDPNANWDDRNPKGFKYKDKTGAEDGVTKASLKTGVAGKSSVSVSAKGTLIPMPAPFSLIEFFNQDPAVTVQLVNDETATCWTSTFTAAGTKKNDPSRFKAKGQ